MLSRGSRPNLPEMRLEPVNSPAHPFDPLAISEWNRAGLLLEKLHGG